MILLQNNRSSKRRLKSLWAWFCTFTHLPDVYLRIRHPFCGSAQVPILLYHRVIPSDKLSKVYSSPHIVVRQDTFEKQMKFISQNYTVLSLDEFLVHRSHEKPLPLKTVIVTFDDGWRDNYMYAFPVLRKYSIPATIFLTTQFVGKKHVFWQEKLRFLLSRLHEHVVNSSVEFPACLQELPTMSRDYFQVQNLKDAIMHLPDKLKYADQIVRNDIIICLEQYLNRPRLPTESNSFLNWEELREMAQFQVTFGSHGASHKILTLLSPKEITEELSASKRQIEEELGVKVTTFAYPDGSYNEFIINKLRAYGYKSALTIKHGFNTTRTNPYCLKRIDVSEDRFSNPRARFSEKLFLTKIAGCL
jgi:peptidoglycan/xylan/chitin deacetylase (PgdA/CDA1 family)